MLILASKSPRRIELMKNYGYDFLSVPAVKEELIPENSSVKEAVTLLAEQKAKEVAESYPDAVVIGADTVVALDGRIMGKPKGETDAFNMLKSLSGRVHEVLTGVCILSPDKRHTFCERTEVEFYPLGDDKINAYIRTGEPMDKAGAYAVQEYGALFVKRINGDFFNVVGLPISRLAQELEAVVNIKNNLM